MRENLIEQLRGGLERAEQRIDTLAVPTQELTRGNCKSQFLGFQGGYKPKVEIPGRGVRILYFTSWRRAGAR